MPQQCKYPDLRFREGDRWEQANSFRGGASAKTCGSKPELRDARPYGIALQVFYPCLYEVFQGEWEAEYLEQMTAAFQQAAAYKSSPLAVFCVLAMSCQPQKHQIQVWKSLTQDAQQVLSRMLALAQDDPDFQKIF
ncbi:hypothetical protein H6G00_01355 [Leptolyngbya sp. FACHB-541]|uniref:hypothetical protein n=1 Tax=Leptolyngbya sp. FACHB-541 TaxID=2692810 RepID=UPI00168456ED|nr:hypothetical protein [Leptolyngbya sp. FACHB-541]MBD1995277.1 hypothetical protein [Leptolyngbya sp. FACHB-541]